eukprot:CAMPEP_0198113478 /NCGR_PEP_ID=MMETSP1442-20131203/5141_1 /TAXON_ID= /ORGANISM="Craspedostauros australis, Strain CCMP3328" /LENGTH=152 /DNA_ID=CAMNT_0043770579 /DNA_START=114 /DNA_END=572 /DNA_ORIENTATION=-
MLMGSPTPSQKSRVSTSQHSRRSSSASSKRRQRRTSHSNNDGSERGDDESLRLLPSPQGRRASATRPDADAHFNKSPYHGLKSSVPSNTAESDAITSPRSVSSKRSSTTTKKKKKKKKKPQAVLSGSQHAESSAAMVVQDGDQSTVRDGDYI